MYKASIENKGDTRYFATTRHAAFVMDTEGKEANPVDTLLAALCGCVGHYVRDFLRDRGIPCAGFTVAAHAAGGSDQVRLAAISLRIDLGDVRLDPAEERDLLVFIERCKVHGTLRQGAPIHAVVEHRGAVVAAAR